MTFLTKRNSFILLIALATGYFFSKDGSITTSVVSTATAFALPLALAAMVGIMCERTGIVNIGIEGTLLTSAFAAFFVSSLTSNILLGLAASVAVGTLFGLLLAVMSVSWKMDQIIAGTIINILATGLTSFLYVQGRTIPSTFPEYDIPKLMDIPFFGPVLFMHGPLFYFGIFVILSLYVALFKTTWGLRSRAVGEHPSSADTAGVSVIRLRYINVAIAGAIGGLAGAFLSLELVGSFERGFTAGKGFTALALMIFGRWNPLGALAAAMFFGLTQAYANQLMIDQVVQIPTQFITILPYVLTIIVLAISAGKVRAPAAEGQPYEKENA
ncbi:MAG: ABC transporter permease [Streptomycetaceae bacterium]|nr:MAG: ABC transporter permease [Streptomycetaceae bacterium]